MTQGSANGERLSGAETAELSRQVSGLARAGLPLAVGLRALGEDLPSDRLRRAFNDLSSRLEAGEPLDRAIEGGGTRFPPHLRGLVRAGLVTGRLGPILEEFVRYEQSGAELRRTLWLGLLYPLTLLAGMGFLFLFLSWVVIADIESLYLDFGIDMPRATQALFGLARALSGQEPALAVVGGLIASITLLMLFGRPILGEAGLRWVLCRVPLLGTVARWTSLSEFCHLLALLLEGNLPLGEAVRLAGDGARDPDLGRVAPRVASEVEGGHTLAEALGRVVWFPRGLPRLLRWGEAHQSLPESLHLIGEMFAARARAEATFMGTLIGTITVLMVIGGIGFLFISLFVPLISLISKLSG